MLSFCWLICSPLIHRSSCLFLRNLLYHYQYSSFIFLVLLALLSCSFPCSVFNFFLAYVIPASYMCSSSDVVAAVSSTPPPIAGMPSSVCQVWREVARDGLAIPSCQTCWDIRRQWNQRFWRSSGRPTAPSMRQLHPAASPRAPHDPCHAQVWRIRLEDHLDGAILG